MPISENERSAPYAWQLTIGDIVLCTGTYVTSCMSSCSSLPLRKFLKFHVLQGLTFRWERDLSALLSGPSRCVLKLCGGCSKSSIARWLRK